MNFKSSLLLILLLLVPSTGTAETVVRSSQKVTINNEQVVAEDLYTKASSIAISGRVLGDVYALGAQLTMNGVIESDLSVLAGVVQVHGNVSDDIRVVGGEVVIADKVGGDVFVLGGSLKLLSTAEVAGDVFFFGGEAEILGTIDGSLMGTYESLKVDSKVGGNVDVSVGNLSLGEKARIAGDISYTGSKVLQRAPSAIVGGEVVQNTPVLNSVSTGDVSFALMSIFGTLVLYLFFRRDLETFADHTIASYKKSLLVGVLVILLIPVAAGVLIYTILGAFVGVLSLAAYVLWLLASYLAMPAYLGLFLHNLYNKNADLSLFSVLLGIGALNIIVLVPLIGGFVTLVLFIIGAGSLALLTYEKVLK
tara:strand:+ start:4208 stop:5302 length:1095 start_codon:yes stop_codon:yes gene_type:complete